MISFVAYDDDGSLLFAARGSEDNQTVTLTNLSEKTKAGLAEVDEDHPAVLLHFLVSNVQGAVGYINTRALAGGVPEVFDTFHVLHAFSFRPSFS
jgi:hypothetical protein